MRDRDAERRSQGLPPVVVDTRSIHRVALMAQVSPASARRAVSFAESAEDYPPLVLVELDDDDVEAW